MGWYSWRPYVPVAERRRQAMKKIEKMKKKGVVIKPVEIEGRKIARTFWGEAWCDHLESFSDYENRLPRGRAYVRNGSVCHLNIGTGSIQAMVSGSELYTVEISIKTLAQKKWGEVKKFCAGKIGSLLELLQGRLSENVMAVVTHRDRGLFPLPGEISLSCSCPDWANMCKHVAAVLYGVGARLDASPELLFLLRGVDHEELISADVEMAVSGTGRRRIAEEALADVFGIEMTEEKPLKKAGKPEKGQKSGTKEKKASRTEVKKKTKTQAKGGRKKAPSKKKLVVTGENSQTREKNLPVTGKEIVELRKKFGMSQAQFARLLGVSAVSVGNWEKKPGTLSLRNHTLSAFNGVKKLTKSKARWKLEE